MSIIVLTLEKHRNGVWVTRLVENLEKFGERVLVVSLENYLRIPSLEKPEGWSAVINRVSDAAEPALVKACLALLQCCETVWRIPVVNGSNAYSLSTSKWCHHVLFNRAGLHSPKTARIHESDDFDGMNTACADLAFPLLIKPNAGGFGAGIVKVNSATELREHMSFGADGVCTIQEYVPPRANEFFRVWFLNGRVQCGIVRTQENPEIFTDGCAAQCSLKDRRKQENANQSPYLIPDSVKYEIETRFLQPLGSAFCGSVEFLYNAQGERLYFDFNLLSTLPTFHGDGSTWANNYDPWQGQASAMIAFIRATNR